MSDVEPKLSHPTGCNEVSLLLPSAVVSELVERLDFHHYSMVKTPPTPKGHVVAMWGAVMKQSSLSQPGRYQWRHSEELELPSLPSTDEEPLPSSVSRGQAGDHLLYPPIGDCNEVAHSPSLSMLQQCQRKPVKTESFNKIQNFPTLYPKCPCFNRKTTHYTKNHEDLTLNERRQQMPTLR